MVMLACVLAFTKNKIYFFRVSVLLDTEKTMDEKDAAKVNGKLTLL